MLKVMLKSSTHHTNKAYLIKCDMCTFDATEKLKKQIASTVPPRGRRHTSVFILEILVFIRCNCFLFS